MLIMLISLILASVITNCVFIFKTGGWNSYQIYNKDFWSNAGEAVSIIHFEFNHFLNS